MYWCKLNVQYCSIDMALVIALYKLSLGDILTFPSYLFTRVIYGLMPIKLDKLTKLCGALNCHETAIEVIIK